MKLISGFATLLVFACLGGAVPVKRVSLLEFVDSLVLNFALTLEYLEVAFYNEGLSRFSDIDFLDAGYPAYTWERFKQIRSNEEAHANILAQILGPNATQPCTYSFPMNDVHDFVSLSATFEAVGTSAYTGITRSLSDPLHTLEAASILAIEARQSAFIMSSVLGQYPWSTSFETPLDLNQAYALATSFIVSCPNTNAPLPISTFPKLNILSLSYAPGENITLAFNSTARGAAKLENGTQPYLALLSGLGQVSVPIRGGFANIWEAEIPEGVKGTMYGIVTNSSSSVADENTIAGVSILHFPFNSSDAQNS